MRFPTSTTLLVATAMIMPFVGTVEAFGVTNTATTQVPVRINSSISFVTTPNYHHMHNHARRHRSSATGPLSMASGPEDIVAAEGVLASLPLFLVPAAAALVGGSGLAQKRALQTDAALVEKQIEGIKQRLSNTDVQITASLGVAVVSAGLVAAQVFGLPNGETTSMSSSSTYIFDDAQEQIVLTPAQDEVQKIVAEMDDAADKAAAAAIPKPLEALQSTEAADVTKLKAVESKLEATTATTKATTATTIPVAPVISSPFNSYLKKLETVGTAALQAVETTTVTKPEATAAIETPKPKSEEAAAVTTTSPKEVEAAAVTEMIKSEIKADVKSDVKSDQDSAADSSLFESLMKKLETTGESVGKPVEAKVDVDSPSSEQSPGETVLSATETKPDVAVAPKAEKPKIAVPIETIASKPLDSFLKKLESAGESMRQGVVDSLNPDDAASSSPTPSSPFNSYLQKLETSSEPKSAESSNADVPIKSLSSLTVEETTKPVDKVSDAIKPTPPLVERTAKTDKNPEATKPADSQATETKSEKATESAKVADVVKVVETEKVAPLAAVTVPEAATPFSGNLYLKKLETTSEKVIEKKAESPKSPPIVLKSNKDDNVKEAAKPMENSAKLDSVAPTSLSMEALPSASVAEKSEAKVEPAKIEAKIDVVAKPVEKAAAPTLTDFLMQKSPPLPQAKEQPMFDLENMDPRVFQAAGVLGFAAVVAVGISSSGSDSSTSATMPAGTKKKDATYLDGLTRSTTNMSNKSASPSSYLDTLKQSQQSSSAKSGVPLSNSYIDNLASKSGGAQSQPKSSFSFGKSISTTLQQDKVPSPPKILSNIRPVETRQNIPINGFGSEPKVSRVATRSTPGVGASYLETVSSDKGDMNPSWYVPTSTKQSQAPVGSSSYLDGMTSPAASQSKNNENNVNGNDQPNSGSYLSGISSGSGKPRAKPSMYGPSGKNPVASGSYLENL